MRLNQVSCSCEKGIESLGDLLPLQREEIAIATALFASR